MSPTTARRPISISGTTSASPAWRRRNPTTSRPGASISRVIESERKGGYLGRTVQVIPHVTDMIKEFVMTGVDDLDFLLVEIGGTVGDIEGLPFFEAIRQLGNDLPRGQTRCFVHLTLVPYIEAAGELKTKPTQHSVKELRAHRHPAGYPAVPRVASHPGRRAPQDRAVLQRADRSASSRRSISTRSIARRWPITTPGFDTQVLKVFGIDDRAAARSVALESGASSA